MSNTAEAQPDLRPELSIVVVVHNMAREAPRTLLSLSSTYQQHIAADEYEIIVVDNGSTPPLDTNVLADLNGNFRLLSLDEAPPSPAHAINLGLAAARGDVIGVMIDGARLATPGLLHFGRAGAKLDPRAIVVSPGWHLGFDQQRWSIQAQYNRSREDALLQSIGWPQDGYRLFEIAALDEPGVECWFGHVYESNGFFLSREMWDLIGGFDERFDAPGGGLVNHDTLLRAFDTPGSELVVLLGEGTFHQLHGGIASNANSETFPASLAEWAAQYEAIRGKPYQTHTKPVRTYLGTLPPPALVHFARSIVEPVGPSPIGPDFDRTLWSLAPASRPTDARAAALVELAETELRARRFEASASVARIARSFAPDELAPQRLLASVSPFARDRGEPVGGRRAGYHLARGKAFRILGDKGNAEAEFRAALALDAESEAAHELQELHGPDAAPVNTPSEEHLARGRAFLSSGENDKAEAEFQAALACEPDLVEAHIGLADLRLPGEGYLAWLRRFHEVLKPESYLEIGVDEGHTLALARPPTRVIGIDPEPRVAVGLQADVQIFAETSDEFFARSGLTALLGAKPLALAFIDGAHVFAQSLRDFMHVESFCGPHSVVLLHDTIPLDEITQRPDRQRRFYTGDVWKTVLCLKRYRPDLDVFTIAAPWSGLTVVAGLDPSSRILVDAYAEAVGNFANMRYADLQGRESERLDIVRNDWTIVLERLKRRNIL